MALEYNAMVQYIQHSGVLTGAAYQSIQKELVVHAQEELQHAITLADQINYLDSTPTAKVPEARTSDENETMLKQDLEGELDAIERYKVRIEQSEKLKLLDLAQKLREILAQEQEHAIDLTQALGK